ncbi:unnamed protein product, partial [Mesorhabditis belari]|uniref:Phosphorylated adapter RNA export protein n=1 Tax=Mesorhabditis belari TaxID=2138241 RepID=A0AAF3FDX3_9BILA
MFRSNDSEDSDEEAELVPKIEIPSLEIDSSNQSEWKNVLMEEGFEMGQVDVQYRVERGAESYVAPGHERPQIEGQASAFDGNLKIPLTSLGTNLDSRASMSKNDPVFGDIFDNLYDLKELEKFGLSQFDANDGRTNHFFKRQAFFIGGRWRNRNFQDGDQASRGDSRKPFMKRKYENVSLEALIAPNYCLDDLLKASLKPNSDLSTLAAEIAHHLGEKKPETIAEIVSAIGGEKACEIFERTKETEKNGGLKTLDGNRRRAPGGVFIFLFREDPSIPFDVKKNCLPNFQQRAYAKSNTYRKGDATLEP